MPLTTMFTGTPAKASDANANWSLCVLTDTAKTISVTHVWAATQQFTTLTASRPVYTDASQNLVSATVTGTGSVVQSVSPTITGTLVLAAATASGLISGSAGLTISAGTSALQAITGTTLVLSSSATIGFGSFAPARLYVDTNLGLVVAGKTGAFYDIALTNNSGGQYLNGITGTQNVLFFGSVAGITSLASGALTITSSSGWSAGTTGTDGIKLIQYNPKSWRLDGLSTGHTLQIGGNITAVDFNGAAASGIATLAMSDYLTLGKAYVAGVVAATGTIAIKDNTGTVYNVLVHT